jgi:hypothetical protein
MRPLFAKALAVIGALPLLAFVVVSLAAEIPRLLDQDPCFVWGSSRSVPIGKPPCVHSVQGTSETKTGAIARLTAVQGTLFVATVLGLVGAFKRRPKLCAAAFLTILLISVPLLLSGLGMITLACGAFFLPSCDWTRARATSHDGAVQP